MLNETEIETGDGAGFDGIPAVEEAPWHWAVRGARRIVVDGTSYRWRLRRRPTCLQALAWTPCTFGVDQADARGTTLVVTTNRPHPSNWFGQEAKPVLPSDVARAIELALREAPRGRLPVAQLRRSRPGRSGPRRPLRGRTPKV